MAHCHVSSDLPEFRLFSPVNRCFAGAGAALTYISGFHRPFSLTDAAISYPLRNDIVSLPVVAIISLIGPAAVIGIVNLGSLLINFVRPSRQNISSTSQSSLVALLWQTHAAWLGLCTGLAVTLFVTAGLKDMVGKPRPNLLARCNPDLTDVANFVVGGFGLTLDSEAPPFVTAAICQQPDRRFLDDGFAAFPSGHSSFNSAGMVYLTLWLCARWHVTIPFLDRFGHRDYGRSSQRDLRRSSERTETAPPLWQVAAAFIPIFVALFVCSSRYADFHHAGFDIIAGALIGTFFGWTAFRLYHQPMRRSRGPIAWQPRSDRHAFLASNSSDVHKSDEEHGRRSMTTELDHLGTSDIPRTATGGSQHPILSVPVDRISRS